MNYSEMLKEWAKRRRKAMALLKSGKTRAEVAEALNISRQRLHAIIRREARAK